MQWQVTFKSYAGEANVIVEAPSMEHAKKMAMSFLEVATADILDVSPLANTKLFRITSFPTMDM